MEPRRLLTCDLSGPGIGGTVFVDVNEDQTVSAGEAVANAFVELYIDDGDGIAEVPGDDVLLSAITTDAAGEYCFDDLESRAGYFVRQPLQTIDGQVLAGQISGVVAPFELGVMIDRFEESQVAVAVPPAPSDDSSALFTADALGDERDLRVQLDNGQGELTAEVNRFRPGMSISTSFGVEGRAEVVWDGIDADARQLSLGLNGIDLTAGGLANAISIRGIADAPDQFAQIRIYEGSEFNFSESTVELPVGFDVSAEIWVPLDSFTGGASPTNVDAIRLVLEQNSTSSDMRIDQIASVGSRIVDFANSLQSDFAISKTNNVTSILPGSTVTYTIVVENLGPNSGFATVSDQMPVALENVTYTSVVSGVAAGNTPAGAGDIFDSVVMDPGAQITYTVTGQLPAEANGELINTATVSVEQFDPNPANNTATDFDPINRPPLTSEDTYEVELGIVLSVNATSGLLANDTDPDGDTLRITDVFDVDEQEFSIDVASDGGFVLTPFRTGSFRFGYVASDGNGSMSPGFVNIIVSEGPNSAPLNLVDFASALNRTGAQLFGFARSPHTTSQLNTFGDGQIVLPYVEAQNPDGTLNQVGVDNGISAAPTWVFPNGDRLIGSQTLQALANAAGLDLNDYRNDEPRLAELPDQTLLAGSPLHVPLNAYDPNGEPMTFEVLIEDPELVSIEQIEPSRSLILESEDFGDMNFRLFEHRAPRATNRVIELASSGFYDGLTFHRVIEDFVIQTGDPLGNGTGGSELPDFDDQYNVELQHNRTGVLGFAKRGNDTNNSQFYITDGDARHLDFRHTVFGQLIEGERTRSNINAVSVGDFGKPELPVTIDQASIVQDNENGLLMLKATGGQSGRTSIQVTAIDAEGNRYTDVFTLDIEPDTVDGLPFLADLPDVVQIPPTGGTLQLTGIDVEADPIQFGAFYDPAELSVEIDPITNIAVFEPTAAFVGESTVTFWVGPDENRDTQEVKIDVTSAPPPTVLSSSLDSINNPFPGPMTVEIVFSETMNAALIDPTDATLVGQTNGEQAPIGFAFDQLTQTLTIRYSDLPADDFEFRLESTATGFTSSDGTLLDGDGDGAPGGDYVIQFSTDNGDLDGDGMTNVRDIDLLCAVIRTGLDNPTFDVNDDGIVNHDDHAFFVATAFNSGPGDANLDGVFNSRDLVIVFVAGEFEDDVQGNSTWAEGDWNCDGEFTSSDFVLALSVGGYVSDSPVIASAASDKTTTQFKLQELIQQSRYYDFERDDDMKKKQRSSGRST